MLQADLHHAIGFLRCRQAFLRLWNGPRHCFLGIEVLAGCKRIQKMPRMDVQRARYDDRVDVFHVEQPPVIVKGLNAGRHLLGFVPASRVNVGDGDELSARNSEHLFEQFLSASTHTNHPHAHAIIGADHSRGWIGRQSCRADRRLSYEFASRVVCHVVSP